MEDKERVRLEEILRRVSIVRREISDEISKAQSVALKLRDYGRTLEGIYNDIADLLNLPHTDV